MQGNISPKILSLTKRKLLEKPDHPLSILKSSVYSYFHSRYPSTFVTKDDFPPVVNVRENFDKLLIPEDHVSRSLSDTYYFDSEKLLRTHTTAHDFEMLGKHDAFLMSGDVYRRDEIDRTHYPAFHQLEGGRIWNLDALSLPSYESAKEYAVDALKDTLEGLSKHIFGETETRWVEAYFPFTEPSLELEVKWQGDWLEVLGSGVYHPQVLRNAGKDEKTFGWAFGIGLERWAMKLFSIPDIRLFWSEDPRFLNQFSREKGIVQFEGYSKYPPCYKDISFWVQDDFSENDFFEVVRDVGGDLVETVEKLDQFSKKGRVSYCYRINYRSMDRSLTNEEIDELQFKLRDLVVSQINVELR